MYICKGNNRINRKFQGLADKSCSTHAHIREFQRILNIWKLKADQGTEHVATQHPRNVQHIFHTGCTSFGSTMFNATLAGMSTIIAIPIIFTIIKVILINRGSRWHFKQVPTKSRLPPGQQVWFEENCFKCFFRKFSAILMTAPGWLCLLCLLVWPFVDPPSTSTPPPSQGHPQGAEDQWIIHKKGQQPMTTTKTEITTTVTTTKQQQN